MHSEGQKLKAAEGMLLNFSLFFSRILFLKSILFVFSAPHNFFFFLSLLIFNFHSFCLISPCPFSQRGSDAGRAAGTRRKQVTSRHAYVKKWRGTMVTKPLKGWVSDGKLERAACFQTKNKRRWRLTQIKFLITSEVAIRGSSRQREQRQEHSVVLHSGVEKWLMCWALFDVYVGQQTHEQGKCGEIKTKTAEMTALAFVFPYIHFTWAKPVIIQTISNHYVWRTH